MLQKKEVKKGGRPDGKIEITIQGNKKDRNKEKKTEANRNEGEEACVPLSVASYHDQVEGRGRRYMFRSLSGCFTNVRPTQIASSLS